MSFYRSYGSDHGGYGYNSDQLASVYDYLPAPASLWSVARRLRRAYTGPVIRVRRSSDNVEQDFYGVGSSGIVFPAAIASFCGAGNGFLVTRYDQSGNARHATQSTTTLQPIVCESGVPVTNSGGRLTMKHPAADARRLAVANSTGTYNFLHTTGGTVLAVATANDTAATKTLLTNKNATNVAGIQCHFPSNETLACYAGRLDVAGVATNGTSVSFTPPVGEATTANTVWAIQFDPDNATASSRLSQWRNGTASAFSNTDAGTPFVENSQGNFTIGARSDGTLPFDGTIGDVGIWQGFLTEAQRKLVEADQGRFNTITVAP
jgi:hypothetical protein